MKKHLIIIGVVVLVIVGTAFLLRTTDREVTQQLPTTDPLDEVIDFYNAWLDAAKATSSDDAFIDVLSTPIISPELKATLQSKLAGATAESADPVLCQVTPPERIGGKMLYQLDTAAQIMMLARGGEEKASDQAIVTLGVDNGNWIITDISCATGEMPPERDFAFEQEGFLLKSVPPPLNPDYWHLVFEQQGVMGHTVPLFFNADSTCIDTAGAESICDADQFTEASKVLVQADMTEAGAEVKRLIFLP
jgi:hypothetical protein